MPHLNNSNGSSPEDEDAVNNAAVMSILDQLAMYDVPQTWNNLNPERPLIRIEKSYMKLRQGNEIEDKNSPFLYVAIGI